MTRELDFYFDYGSPNAYLAHARLPAILRRAGTHVAYKIMLLGGVFQATGNVSPAALKFKAPNSHADILRFANKLSIPYRRNPFFPINTLKLMRGAVVAEEDGFLERYSDVVFSAMWRDGLDMGEEEVFAGMLRTGGIDERHVLTRINDDGVKSKLKSYTEAAARRGVFGAPTFFVGEEMFFGQDRLDFVEDALVGRSYLDIK